MALLEWPQMYRAVVPVHVNAPDVFSASVNIYCLKHYTVDKENDTNQHFVQYAGTFSDLFMLVCVGIILILFKKKKSLSIIDLLCGPL